MKYKEECHKMLAKINKKLSDNGYSHRLSFVEIDKDSNTRVLLGKRFDIVLKDENNTPGAIYLGAGQFIIKDYRDLLLSLTSFYDGLWLGIL